MGEAAGPDDPVERFGSAKRPDRPVAKPRPDGVSDATVAALGKLSAALEVVEHARGLLYAFHRYCGTADLELQEAVADLRSAGHPQLADELDDVLVGRDLFDDKWSFQIVEGYDANYWQVFRALEQRARQVAGALDQHVFEAEMKHREQQ
jgi:hypothetical protein